MKVLQTFGLCAPAVWAKVLPFTQFAARMHDSVVLLSPSAHIAYCNAAFCQLVGRLPGQLLGQPITAYMSAISVREFQTRWLQRRLGADEQYELTWLLPDGAAVHTSAAPLPLFDDTGTFQGSVAVLADLSERDRINTELSIARRIVSNSASVLYRARVEEGFPAEYVSGNVERYGYSPEEFVSRRTRWQDVLHEDDRERVLAELRLKLAAGTTSFIMNYRLRTASGAVVWIEHQSIVHDRPGGAALLLDGLLTDVTERHQARHSLRQALAQSIRAIGSVIDKRDPYTGIHHRRVADLAVAIGHHMRLNPERIEGLYLGALIHDVGKIAIPGDLLAKPGRVNEMERELLQSHVQAGLDILEHTVFPWPIIEIIAQHHERLDGSGYPNGLSGSQIGLEGRIVAVCDVLEAMSEHRPYRPALGVTAALSELDAHRGTRFDADVVDACAAVVRQHMSGDSVLWEQLDQQSSSDSTVVRPILKISPLADA